MYSGTSDNGTGHFVINIGRFWRCTSKVNVWDLKVCPLMGGFSVASLFGVSCIGSSI